LRHSAIPWTLGLIDRHSNVIDEFDESPEGIDLLQQKLATRSPTDIVVE
jgi:hypothetical protein